MTPHRLNQRYAVAQTPEARLQVMRAIHALVAQDHVQKASADDLEHPGWPAGTADGKGGKFRPKDNGATVVAARRISAGQEAECEEQYERDKFQCQMVGLPGCYEQAMLRYSNCLRGLPIPPFNY